MLPLSVTVLRGKPHLSQLITTHNDGLDSLSPIWGLVYGCQEWMYMSNIQLIIFNCKIMFSAWIIWTTGFLHLILDVKHPLHQWCTANDVSKTVSLLHFNRFFYWLTSNEIQFLLTLLTSIIIVLSMVKLLSCKLATHFCYIFVWTTCAAKWSSLGSIPPINNISCIYLITSITSPCQKVINIIQSTESMFYDTFLLLNLNVNLNA